MPKKKTNTELINNYLEHIKKEKKVSDGTIKTYKNVGESLPFNLLSNQTTIIKKLKELYNNANTLQLYLNMIILVRRFDNEETDLILNGVSKERLPPETVAKLEKQGMMRYYGVLGRNLKTLIEKSI